MTGFEHHTALFGGSFDPPHLGHRVAIEGLLAHPGVARTLVLPSWGTPLKSVPTPFQDRLAMARLALQGVAEISTIESDLSIRYTWELLQALGSRYGKTAFVIGTDQFCTLRRWARFPEVLGLTDWLVLRRKSSSADSVELNLQNFIQEGILRPTDHPDHFEVIHGNRKLRFVETPAPPLSSTQIREHFALNQPEKVEPLIAPAVMDYIKRNKLYGT